MKTIESELGASECYRTEILPAIAQLNWIIIINLYAWCLWTNEKLNFLLSLIISQGTTVNFLQYFVAFL